ncbi:MAG: MBL fold metallo-hydrolase, partial [Pseudomonadota bacterium]
RLAEDLVISSTHVHHGPVAAVAWRIDIDDCSLAFSGDMSNRFDTFATLAKGVDIMVMHNAVPENAGRVARNLHMTPSEIGRIASEAAPARVILSHFMNRTQGRQQDTLQAIRKTYAGPVELATDGKRYALAE